MSEKNYGDNLQLSEIVKYISDTIRFPVLGVGGGYAPIGTIIMRLSSTAPQGFLLCDGSVYNISDYPDLAIHFASDPEIGSINAYGGDGTTTFAVPDLRGEFIRMCGTNSHTNQGDGGTLGQHQDATEHMSIGTGNGYTFIYSAIEADNQAAKYTGNKDSVKNLNRGAYIQRIGDNAYNDNDVPDTYTARPTNTSVNFYIKATVSDAEIAAYHIYTPNEHQVGWWQEEVDGVLKQKPVYEKTLTFTYTGSNIPYDFSDTERIVDYNFIAQDSDSRTLTWHNNTWGSYTQGACAGAMTGSSGSYWWIWFSDSGYWDNAKMSITWKYTKTSDQWQTI